MTKQFLLLVFIILIGCKQGENKQSVPTAASPPYPILPSEIKQSLHQTVDYIDYVFRELPISASFGPDQGINMNINFISDLPVLSLPAGCKSIGRKSFQNRGEIILEADIYYGTGCMYYVFFEESKATYASMMTNEGVNFYSNIISQVNNRPGQ